MDAEESERVSLRVLIGKYTAGVKVLEKGRRVLSERRGAKSFHFYLLSIAGF